MSPSGVQFPQGLPSGLHCKVKRPEGRKGEDEGRNWLKEMEEELFWRLGMLGGPDLRETDCASNWICDRQNTAAFLGCYPVSGWHISRT